MVWRNTMCSGQEGEMVVKNKFVATFWAVGILLSILACGGGGGGSSSGGSSGGGTSTGGSTGGTTTTSTCGGPSSISCSSGSQSCFYEPSQACGTFGSYGECRERPSLSSCSTMVNEVCGCDGQTYANTCVAAANGVSVEHAGPCREDNYLLVDCRDPQTWPDAWKEFEKEVVAEMNRRRAQGATCRGTYYGPAGPLVMDNALQQAARCHSLDMGMRDYFAHNSPEGIDPFDRMRAAGYTGSPRGENLAAGQRTALDAVNAWMGSTTGHCEGIMDATANEVGAGYAFVETSHYRHYWTSKFGIRR
jgi:uncharacterized protein YkwD